MRPRYFVAVILALPLAGICAATVVDMWRPWVSYRYRHSDIEACGPLRTDADVGAQVKVINAMTKRGMGHHVINGGDFWCIERAQLGRSDNGFEWLAAPVTDDMKDRVDKAIPR